MDGGLEQAYLLVSKYCTEEANQFIRNPYKKNYKSLLQFLTQKYLKITPTYEASSTAGPNNTKIFTSCAVIKGKKFLYGQAKNKKEAEQMAAYLAVQTLASENSEIRDYVYNVLSLEKEFSYKPNLPPSQRKGIKKIFQIFDWLTQ
jgi:dsRNA-specific ribonuclease